MKNLLSWAKEQPRWTLEEFVAVANELLPHYLPIDRPVNNKLKEDVNSRLIRYYTTQKLLGEPEKEGRNAVYIYKHLLQLLLLRRMLTEGYSALSIGNFIKEQSVEKMEAILTGETPLEIKPIEPATRYMEKLSKSMSSLKHSHPDLDSPATWLVWEVEPGLEIAIRSDFKPPATLSEQQKLNDRVVEKISRLMKRVKK